jgi:hypothetical protein
MLQSRTFVVNIKWCRVHAAARFARPASQAIR